MNLKNLSFAAILLILLTFCLGISGVYAIDGMDLAPTDNTYVSSREPASNFGGVYAFAIENSTILSNTWEEVAWLKFDLSTVPKDASIVNASLQLYTYTVSETTNIQAYYCPNNSWSEWNITYSNSPSYDITPIDSETVASPSQTYNWNVTQAVENALHNNADAVTIVLGQQDQSTKISYVAFNSRENLFSNSDYSPRLAIKYNSAPSPTSTPTSTTTMPEFTLFLIATAIAIVVILVSVIFWISRRRHLRSSV
jgi:hypothetical protein